MNSKALTLLVILLILLVVFQSLNEKKPRTAIVYMPQFNIHPISYVIQGSGNIIGDQNEVQNHINETC